MKKLRLLISVVLLGTVLNALVSMAPLTTRFSEASSNVIVVTTEANSGAGSLREAIDDAVNIATEDTVITFDSSVNSITLTSYLPRLLGNDYAITIDGGNDVVISAGSSFPDPVIQIGSPSDNSTNNIIKNLSLMGFPNGILIYGDNNRIENVDINGNVTDDSCEGEIGIAVAERTGSVSAAGNSLVGNSIKCYRKGILAINADNLNINNNSLSTNNVDSDITFIADLDVCYTAGIQIQGTPWIEDESDFSANIFVTNNVINNNGFEFDPESTTNCDEDDFLSAGIIIDDGTDAIIGFPLPAANVAIDHNQINNNQGSGIVLRHTFRTTVSDNTIYRNGVGEDEDAGNGITLMCSRDVGSDLDGSFGNSIVNNTIYNNADNGIQIGHNCADPEEQGELLPRTMAYNSILGNSIYANGFLSEDADDDGIAIDLTPDPTVGGSSYTAENPYVSLNDEGDDDNGGNNMLNSPVIESAEYNTSTGIWTISGTVDLDTATGATLELYQVSCAGDANSFAIVNCDADTAEGEIDPEEYGYGEGRTFVGRILLESGRDSNDWTAELPVDAGFNGGLLTSTLTTSSLDETQCNDNPLSSGTYLNSDDLSPEPFVCDTSEFGANFRAQFITDSLNLNSFITHESVPQGGTQVILLALSNNGNSTFTNVEFSNELPAGVTYVPGTCFLSTSGDDSSAFPCEFTGDTITFEDEEDSALPPGITYYVRFEALVDEDADLGVVTNTGSVLTEPTYESDLVSAKQFTIEAADFDGGSSNLLACSDPDAEDTEPDATFTIDSTAHTFGVFNTTAHTATFEPVNPTDGNPEFGWEWRLDGAIIASGSGETLEPQEIALTAGSHIVSYDILDCTGDKAFDSVALNVANSSSGNTEVALTKVITPTTDVENGDIVTIDIGVLSASGSDPITTITLDDNLTGLSTTVPVCNFAIDTIPTSASAPCTVSSAGGIPITLPSGGLQAGHKLNIRYLATVSGNPGTYTNAVTYVSSTPALDEAPIVVSTNHTIVASSACTGTESVDAEFTVNGTATTGTSLAASGAGSFTFANTNTDGDGDITYHWFVNNVLQTSENASSLVRTLSANTTVTLIKSDCNGSTDSDTVTVTFSTASGTPGPFTIVKRTADGEDKYALSDNVIAYEVAITNTDTAAAHVYSLVDPIPDAFLATVNVTDAVGGTGASANRQVIVNNIPIAAGATAVVKYTLTLEDKNDFPLDGYDLDSSAKKTEDDLYFDTINEASVTTTSNSHSSTSAILGAPDKKFVSLGDDGEIVVELEADKAVIDGSGDDFALYLIDNHIDDTDKSTESRKVSVSQDGTRFVRVSGDDGSYDISRTRLSWIKFIKIEDQSESVAAKAPGTDIEAVCILNVGVPVGATAQVTSGTVSHQAANEVYVDVTKAFDHPLKKSDCVEPESDIIAPAQLPAAPIIKDARTIELTPPPIPTPVVPPVQLPKTGPGLIVMSGLAAMGAYVFNRRNRK